MTLLPPTSSVLLFGGSDGNEFFKDVYVLEPAQYAAVDAVQPRTAVDAADNGPPSVALSAAMTSGDPFSTEEQDQEPDAEPLAQTLVWKRLVVTQAPCAPPLGRRFSRPSSASSTSSSSSSLASQPQDPMPLPGGGRDHHTMHYVPSPTEDERARGFRVLVLGNVLVSDASTAEADSQQSFEMHEMRVEELRVRQPMLDAQWSTKPVKSMWKPKARHAHCSALVGDQLFCFGGKDATSTNFFNDLFYFDVALRQWRSVATTGTSPAPRALATLSASPTQEHLILYGGSNNQKHFAGMYLFDIPAGRWDSLVQNGDRPSRARQQEAMTASEVALRTQNDRLEQRHDVLSRRCEAMERRVETLEREKRELHEQLVAAEAEVFAYRKTMQNVVPSLSSTLTSAIEDAARQQASASSMIETKLSLLHDILDDIRHASGERTEPDDSPQKRSGTDTGGTIHHMGLAVVYSETD
ncbi:hypothetical protein P43SY_005145 [Pythium insidiosum]|uniref:Galactose oxidase n=1 Tax=Pythium insidiosum TaxID=114742 RepID=A0AAD5Q2N5_PYTIN|nr:hypothetical protein P43SY_005145 [Pythium insidiosum]